MKITIHEEKSSHFTFHREKKWQIMSHKNTLYHPLWRQPNQNAGCKSYDEPASYQGSSHCILHEYEKSVKMWNFESLLWLVHQLSLRCDACNHATNWKKQVLQTDIHITGKNANRKEADKLGIYKHDQKVDLGSTKKQL